MPHWQVMFGIGGGGFLGLSWGAHSWIIRRDPDPPSLLSTLPHPASLLEAWPSEQVTWTDDPNVAHFDPKTRHITVSRQWTSTSPLVVCHVVAHERQHANQPRWQTLLAGWHIGFALGWGVIGGVVAHWWPGAIWTAAVGQWLWDVAWRQLGEWDADAHATQRLVARLPLPLDQSLVRNWGRRMARRHAWALALDGAGWSGLTIMIAVVVSGIFHHV